MTRKSPSSPSLYFTLLYGLSHYSTIASAYSWYFLENPKQCSNLTFKITGDDGVPPYRILILPFGASPLPNNVEARRIIDVPAFNGDTTSIKLPYPHNSQFVAVVSDARGFGSGGTSVGAVVTASDDASCFDSSKSVEPLFFFSITPENQIVQCKDTRVWWDKSTVQGTPNFLGVIPGGQSFAIPPGQITDIPSQGTGFTWNANIRAGTTMFLVGGDNRGNGTAGSSLNLVVAGPNPDSSCLNNNSPSSTPGSPAGGSYPTDQPNNPNSGGSSSNTGAIVGGVVGALALLTALILVIFFYRRRSKSRSRRRDKPVDLNEDDEDEAGNGRQSRNDLPQFYQPEPFTVPDPTQASTYGTDRDRDGQLTEDGRPLSGTSTSFYTRSTTPDGSMAFGYGAGMHSAHGHGSAHGGTSSVGGTSRKGAPPRVMRPVNIIQHDDAGPNIPPPPADEQPETIELPPAYTALKDIPSRGN